MVVVRNLRMTGYIGLDTQLVAGYVVFGTQCHGCDSGVLDTVSRRLDLVSVLDRRLHVFVKFFATWLSMDNGQVGGSTNLRMRQWTMVWIAADYAG